MNHFLIPFDACGTSATAHRLRAKGGRTAGRTARESKAPARNRHPCRFLSWPLRLRLPSKPGLDDHRPAAALCSWAHAATQLRSSGPGGLGRGRSRLWWPGAGAVEEPKARRNLSRSRSCSKPLLLIARLRRRGNRLMFSPPPETPHPFLLSKILYHGS